MITLKEKYNKEVILEMKKVFGYKNNLAIPKIIKVVVSTGIGSLKDDSKKEIIEKSMTLITGQKAKSNAAKKSIASFKLREGMPIGYSVTLRGARMDDFLEKFINVAIPRIRDFRGLNKNAVDNTGNLTVSIREHIIFPEVSDQDIRTAFGLGVTIVTSAKTKEEALKLLELLGFPFSKK